MSRFRLTTLSSRLLQLRGLSQAAQQTSQRNPIAALSDYHAALRRSQIAHRQSTKWRTPSTSAKPSTKPNTPPVTESRSARLIVSYHDLERALQARGLNTARVFFMSAAAVAIAVGFSWPKIKKWGAVEGAEVAAASLEREELQMKASAMLQEVLKDPKTAEQVEGMLRGVVTNMLEDKEFYDRMVTWTAAVFKDMLTWDEVRAAGTAYVTSVLEDPQSKKSAEEYLAQSVQKVAADEVVQDSVASVSFLCARKEQSYAIPRTLDEG